MDRRRRDRHALPISITARASFLRFLNVILTLHISGSGLSPHFLDRCWDIFTQNVLRLLAGQPLLNELTAAQLSGA